MMYLKQFFNFYINASIHVALAVYSLVRITELYFGFPYNENLDYFIFFSTISGYNFVKYFGIAKFHHRSLTKNLKTIQVFSFVCFVLMCYYGFLLPTKLLVLFLPLGLLTVLYAIPFLSGFQKSLRSISYLKIIIVALVWSGTTVLFPVLTNDKMIDTNIFLLCIQRFLIVAVLILPFDIRDLKYDAISLQTIPQKIGVEKTKKLGFVLLLFASIIEFLISTETVTKNIFLGVVLVLLILLMRSKTEQSKYYSSFWVEALPIFWMLLLFLNS